MQSPNILVSVNKNPNAATLQITVSNRTSNPKTQDSFDPNEDITRPIFSKRSLAAFISWDIECLGSDVYEKLISFLVCLELFVGCRTMMPQKPGLSGEIISVWGGNESLWWLLMEDESKLQDTILVMGDWTGKALITNNMRRIFWQDALL